MNAPDSGEPPAPLLSEETSHPQPKPLSLMERGPWTNPIAYVALPMAALGAGILKLPIAAFIGIFITLGGLFMFGVAFILAATVQFTNRPSDRAKLCYVRGALNVLGLLCLFGAILFAVWPLVGIGGIRGGSAPVDLWRVLVAILLAECAAAGLASIALRGQELMSERWWMATAYWSCFVPAAAVVAQCLSLMGWHSRN